MKAGLGEGFRYVHCKLVVIGIKVSFLLLFLSLLFFLLHGVFLSAKSPKVLCACVKLHPQSHMYLQIYAHPHCIRAFCVKLFRAGILASYI